MKRKTNTDIVVSDAVAIATLAEAAQLIKSSTQILRANKAHYQATNLPVSDAVDKVLDCLLRDATYLEELATICTDAQPTLRKFGS